MIFLLIVCWGAFFFWVLILLDRRRAWPASQKIPRPGDPEDPYGLSAGGGRAPGVVAIVPARNEANLLPETLPALLAQDFPRFRIILVDDRSDDGTALCARGLASKAGCPERLQVVQGTPTPPGWTGKLHALQVGLSAVDSGPPGGGNPGRHGSSRGSEIEWILLTDADIRHPPDSIRALLRKAETGSHDLVSVMARLRAENFWERLLIPPFVFFFQLLYPFRLASSPRSKVSAAAGGCILVRRDILRSAGAFSSIAGEIIDDVALARAVRGAGGKPWLGLDERIESCRGYPRLADLWRMVARTAFVQLRRRYDLLLLTVLILLWILVAPPLLFATALCLGWPLPALAALGGWLIPAFLLLPSVRHHRVPRIFALLLPAASLLYLLMTVSSALDHLRGRGPLWRDRRFGG